MEPWIVLLAACWLLVTLGVAGLCAAAANGDRLVRGAVEDLRDAHWSSLER